MNVDEPPDLPDDYVWLYLVIPGGTPADDFTGAIPLANYFPNLVSYKWSPSPVTLCFDYLL